METDEILHPEILVSNLSQARGQPQFWRGQGNFLRQRTNFEGNSLHYYEYHNTITVKIAFVGFIFFLGGGAQKKLGTVATSGPVAMCL